MTLKVAVPKLPEILAYPEIPTLKQIREINDQFVYVIRGYPLNGIAVLIDRKDEHVYIRFGDFSAKRIDPMNDKSANGKLAREFMEKYSTQFVQMMQVARVPHALYYIVRDDKIRLVDMRTSLNKFAGPGMLRDLWSKVIDTQEVIKTVQMTPDILKVINKGTGSYKGKLILKTSVFKTVTRGKSPKLRMLPMYARIRL